MEQQIVDFVRKMGGGVTFVELMNLLGERAKGNHSYCIGDNATIVLWTGISLAFSEAIHHLLQEKRLEQVPTLMLTYILEGDILGLPIAKGNYNYEKSHWLPVIFNLGSAESVNEGKE